MDRKVYNFSTEQVGSRLVSWLRTRGEPATAADLVAGTGLPKFQVEQTMKSVVNEYAGHLQVSESGELAYYFPQGMRSTVRGVGPAFRRGLRAFLKGAGKALAFAFKIWIVVMLVGYFVLFVALALLAVFAAIAASASSRDRDRRRGPGGGGMMFMVVRLLDFALRMWFWSSLLGGQGQRQRKPRSRPLYKAVFAFQFGEPDPNRAYDDELRRHAIAYIRSRRGVITLEELMAMTGLDQAGAERLVNRWLLEFEGEPGVTESGTLIYSFPELLRSSAEDQRHFTAEPGQAPERTPEPFDANPRKTDNWIVFFNIVNILFGGYFLFTSLAFPAAASIGPGFVWLYQVAGGLLLNVVANPGPLLAVGLGVIPLAFSVVFFIVPAVRRSALNKANERIKTEGLARRIYARILANPSRVDPREIRPLGADLDPKGFEGIRKHIFDRFAGAKGGEPEALPDGGFVYRFAELERERDDLERHRRSIDLEKYAVGKTVFDTGN